MLTARALSRPKPPEAGAEGQPLRGFAHRRPSPVEIEGPRGCPSAAPFLAAHRAFPRAKTCVVVGMRQLLVRVGSDRPGQDPGRTPSIAAAAAFDVLVLLGAPEDRASGAFAFGRGLDFPPFLIRSEASLHEAEAEGLHARIRGSWNSRPIGLIREARRRGTEGTGPILTAASCSHSPARRPAHLGGFSGSVGISFPGLIHQTLNRASRLAPAGPPHASASRAPSGMTPVCR